MKLEDKPGHAAALKRAEGKQKELEAMADAIAATPVRSFADVVLRARLAEYWDDRLDDAFGNDTRSTAELVSAVLASVEPLPRTDNVIRTIYAPIAALGGSDESRRRAEENARLAQSTPDLVRSIQ
jgi:hypothetical protein